MRPRDGRAALRVAPGHQPELQRIIICLLRETADLKGGSLLEIAPDDWLLTEAPTPEAERLHALISKLLPESQVQLLPLPQSKAVLGGFLGAVPAPKFLDLPAPAPVSLLGLEARLGRINLAQMVARRSYVTLSPQGDPALRLQRLAKIRRSGKLRRVRHQQRARGPAFFRRPVGFAQRPSFAEQATTGQ